MLGAHALQSLKGIKTWGKFLGWLMIITGAISALFGLFAFIIGAIPGVISIFLGLFILKTAKSAERLLIEYSENDLEELLNNYMKYLKVTGILILIYIVFVLILFFFGFATFFSGISYYP